jgi:putative membrane protein
MLSAFCSLALATLVADSAGTTDDTKLTNGRPLASQPAATPDAATTEGFRMIALMSNSFQLQASELAATRAHDPTVRRYAQEMIPIHERSTSKLTTGPAGGSDQSDVAVVTAAAKGVRAPLDASLQGLLDELIAAPPGPAFDTAFGATQVKAHRMVIEAYETYLRTGTNPAVKAFVSESLPMMKDNAVRAAALPGGTPGR